MDGFSRHRVYHITNQHGFRAEKRFRGFNHWNRTVLRKQTQWVEHSCRPLHLRLARTTKLGDYSNILISVCRVQDLTPEYLKFKQNIKWHQDTLREHPRMQTNDTIVHLLMLDSLQISQSQRLTSRGKPMC